MCMFSSPETPQVEKYKESAQSQEPDNAAAMTAAARRSTDKIRAGTSTILTSGNGVLTSADTKKSVLLGG